MDSEARGVGMETEQRGRASRASSTSSLGREVRCGCQYYQSDSLLPERRALLGRPSSRTMQQPPAVRCRIWNIPLYRTMNQSSCSTSFTYRAVYPCKRSATNNTNRRTNSDNKMPVRTRRKRVTFRNSEHEYEPIAAPSPTPTATSKPPAAPVVRITDTDMMPVADSDDSIDDRGHNLPPELTRDGDVVLPLDGKLEDNAMEGRELGEAGDTSEELETPQQLQDRLEERFLSTATPGTESRTDGEVNTSQVDSLALEELPLRRGARGLPQRLKTQAGKLRTRLRNFQRPTFAFSERQKPEKTRSTSSGRSDRSRSEKRPTRMERIRSSFSERPKFSLPSRPKFNFPDRSKFHLPERPKFNLPERAKFHLPERPKFNIKKPNIHLPSALTRAKKSSTVTEERSTDSSTGTKRNIFDFATYPRMFDRKSKNKGEFATSTPKDSRAQSTESATLPRARKGAPMSERWAQRFDDTAYIDEDRPDAMTTIERSRPWRHPSLEQPRLSIRTEEEVLAAIPWENKRGRDHDEELQFMDYEQESPEVSERQVAPKSVEASRTEEESFEGEPIELDPRLYGDQKVKHVYSRVPKDAMGDEEDWDVKEEMIGQKDFRLIKRSHSLGEDVLRAEVDDRYEGSFPAVDPRRQYGPPKFPSEEEEYEDDIEADEELEPSSAHSDREQQQSSGSSCDRRRRGIIEEIDSDEFFLRASGLNQDEVNLGKYFTHEIRDALKAGMGNALADDSMMGVPPQRPMRTRSLRKRKESSVESYDVAPPIRPKRDQARSRRSESGDDFRERTRSDSRHRVVYQAEGSPREMTPMEPLDDIVVVKPLRRKSRSSQRSQSQISSTPPEPPTPTPLPPAVPSRRKRLHRDTPVARRNGDVMPMCNGHTEWARTDSAPEKPLPLPPTLPVDLHDDREVLTAEDIMAASEEDIRELVTRLRQEQFVEPFPIPPKRRSRSRGTSIAQDEDRTSHGAESLPEAGYFEEDIPQDDLDFGRDLSGYAIIDKREKPPRPPPPRRRREKFATTPRPIAPKRPQRAYSTLGPGKSRETSILSDAISTTLEPGESTPYIEIDSDDGEHKDLRSGQVLSKMQGRPLPAPPRPPRVRKDRSLERSARSVQEFSMESTIATQTDPLPDDMIIEEEVTQAKLVVAPSMSGSQVLVSMERIPSPSAMSTPPVPPLPVSQRLRREEHVAPAYDTVSLKSPSPLRDLEELEDRHLSAPQLEEPLRDDEATTRAVRAALLSEETIRIGNLEVGDLRVDRLSVSQIDAGKIVASEVDALVITASELRNMGGSLEENVSPSIIKELIAIRSHLEAVAASRAQEIRAESMRALEQQTKTDIPAKDTQNIEEKPRLEEAASDQQPSTTEDGKSKSNEDQKVVKREVIEVKDKETPITRTLSVAQVEVKDKEMLVTNTLAVSQVDIRDKEIPTTHSLTVHQDTQDKSLRILDSESPISLRTGKEPKVEESRASLPPSARSTPERTELRLSPERASESTTQQPESDSKPPPEFATYTAEPFDSESSADTTEKKARKSRSRSPSPSTGISPVRQTASPVRSLPPVISVTPDSPDTAMGHGISSETQQPQRAVISYSSYTEQSDARSERESQRESSQSPIPSFPPLSGTHFIAIPTSQLPAQFFSMVGQASQRIDSDPSVSDTMRQLIRALRLIGIKAMRHFVGFVSSSVAGEESREKIREVELALCALLLLIAGLLVFFFGSTKTVTHHHHWDYFNPPQ